ncbi:hypothetical protein MXD60_13735, partial [Frankia sp. AgB32]|nr:hypothetical protein [Frankia sp. AgB32]
MMSATLLTDPTHHLDPDDTPAAPAPHATPPVDHPRPGPPAPPAVDMGIDPDNAPLAEVGESICRWAGRFAAATCGWLGLLAAFDRRRGWTAIGINSCA